MGSSRATRATMPELVSLAWPIAAAMLGETALGLSDTKLVGALGASALGGVGIATILLFLGYAIIFGLMRGVKVRTAYAVGEGRPADAVRYAEAGALLGAAGGVVVWVVSRDVHPCCTRSASSLRWCPTRGTSWRRARGAPSAPARRRRSSTTFKASATRGRPWRSACSATS